MIFTKKKATFNLISVNEIVLLKGSEIEPLKQSARAQVIAQRAKYTSDLIVMQDVNFKTLSEAAAFVLGCNANGKKYFLKALEMIQQGHANLAANSIETATTGKNEEENKEERKKTPLPPI